jgi:hypothetical protein
MHVPMETAPYINPLPDEIRKVAGLGCNEVSEASRGQRPELLGRYKDAKLVFAKNGLCISLGGSKELCRSCTPERIMCEIVSDMIPDDEAAYAYEVGRFEVQAHGDSATSDMLTPYFVK